MFSRWIKATLLAIAVMWPGMVGAQSPPLVMKLGTATINDSTHEWLKLFAGHIAQDAGGRIKSRFIRQASSAPRRA